MTHRAHSRQLRLALPQRRLALDACIAAEGERRGVTTAPDDAKHANQDRLGYPRLEKLLMADIVTSHYCPKPKLSKP